MNTKRTILSTVLALALSGCGGGGDSRGAGGTGGTGGTGGDGTPTPMQGVFIDSAVAGIHYETATQSGETDADGQFNYLPGETVTFSIGSIALPPIQASAKVTPLMVFATNDFTDQRVVNLGRLLQSLDDDGDLENGIQITANARSAATGITLDLDVAPATFGNNDQLINLLAAGGGSTTLVSPENAIAHMQEQAAKNGLSLVGTWFVQEEGSVITGTFFADGTYMLIENEEGVASGGSEGPGVEYGTYTWDPVSGKLTATVSLDTNGEWGLSHPLGEMKIILDGDSAVFSESDDDEGSTTLTRLVKDSDNALAGTWLVDGQGDKVSLFVFLPGNQYVLGETGIAEGDGMPGIEHGLYSWNKDTFAFSLGEIINDTNGDSGIADDVPLTVQVDGNTLIATFDGGDQATLTRLP